MEAREFLNSYRNAFRKRRILIEQIHDMEDRLMMVRSMDYSADPVCTSPRGDAIPAAVAALVDAQAAFVRQEQEALRAQQEVSNVIEQLAEPREREALYWRYIMCRKTEEIADKMYMSTRQTFRVLAEAEMHVAGILEGGAEPEPEANV